MYKVLIIDDEAPARIAISRLGHWADYHITELYQETNGAAALKTMREIKAPDCFCRYADAGYEWHGISGKGFP